MRTITTTIDISNDGTATISQRMDLAPGRHEAVIVLQENAVSGGTRRSIQWPVVNAKLIDPDNHFRREDMYDDDGR